MGRGISFVVAVLAAGLVASPAGAAPSRLDLVGPDGNFSCLTGEVWAGTPDGSGHVVIHQTGDVVSALVKIRQGVPNTVYYVRLVQVSDTYIDCHDGFVEVTTNAAGQATIRMDEAVHPDAIGFNVAVNKGAEFGAPHWVGAETVPADR